MRILVHVRPYSKKIFTEVAEDVFGDCKIDTISEFRNCGDYWERDFSAEQGLDMDLDNDVVEDIICRDRYLRLLPAESAARIVRRFWNGVDRLFYCNNYRYVLLHPIDCHVQDIIERVARAHGVMPISFVGSFIGGYIKFTLRGEGVDIRDEVEPCEVEKITTALKDKYFLPDSETDHVRRDRRDVVAYYMRRRAIELLYNPMLRFFTRDWDNQQYGTKLVGDSKLRDLMPTNYDEFFLTPEEIDFDKHSIYLPLHYTPEQTTDYFCKHIAKVGYEAYISKLIDEAADGPMFLVKEHPAMYGKRHVAFYRDLSERSNVRLIHPLSPSNLLLEKVDNVLVDNGTVGVEALIRGKRVLSFEENYYSELHPNIHLINRIDSGVLELPTVDYSDKLFVKDLLKQLYPSDFISNKYMNSCDPQAIASALRRFLSRYDS